MGREMNKTLKKMNINLIKVTFLNESITDCEMHLEITEEEDLFEREAITHINDGKVSTEMLERLEHHAIAGNVVGIELQTVEGFISGEAFLHGLFCSKAGYVTMKMTASGELTLSQLND